MKSRWRFTIRASGVLGIGVALPIVLFAIVQGVLLSALPCANPERLALLFARSERKPGERLPISGLNLRDLGTQMRTVEGFGAILPVRELPVWVSGAVENVPAAYVSDGLLPLLDISPSRGHWFSEAPGRPRREPGVVIVSEHFWRHRMNSSPDAIGATVALPEPASVVGIVPDVPLLSLIFGIQPDLYFPLEAHPGWYGRSSFGFQALLRLRSSVSLEAVRSELELRANQLRNAYPNDNRDFNPAIAPIRDVIFGRSESVLWLLFLATGVVWGLSALNFGGLLALRLQERRAELEIKCALGAGIRHIVYAISSEVPTVAGIGASVGVAVGWVGIQFVKTHAAWFKAPRLDLVRVDAVVLLFGISVTAVGCLFAILLNMGVVVRLCRGGVWRNGLGQRYTNASVLGKALVAFQLCLAMVVANIAAITGRSLMRVEMRPLGYNPRHVLAMQVRSEPQGGQRTADAVMEYAATLPGVEVATYAYPRPSVKEFITEFSLHRGSRLGDAPAVRRDAAENFFRVMGIPLLRGRLFSSSQDVLSGAVVVNAAFARAYSGHQDLIGRSVSWAYTGEDQLFHIIGIVGDCLDSPLENAQPTVYFPNFRGATELLIRTSAPEAVVRPVTEFIRRIDPNASITDIEMLADSIQAPLGQAKMQTFLSALFALASMVVASAGLYGLVQHSGEARRQEYAIHVAMGATAFQLIRRRLIETLWTAGAGLGAGMVLSLASGRILAAMLFRVPASDPEMSALAAMVLLLLAVCAAYRPIKASAGIDPSELLRAV